MDPEKKMELPPGPWMDEPDHIKWNDAATGLPCIMNRNQMGAWCGYVAVPPTHKYHGKHYDDVPVEVHGGLTYADKCHGVICHVPEPGQSDDVWWLGFDCSHAGDLTPSMLKYVGFMEHEAYRDEEYVRREVTDLAAQLAAAA